MPIFKKDVVLFDAPGGNPTDKIAHMGGKADILNDKQPPWLQVRATDEPGDPTGWVLRASVDQTASGFVPFQGADRDAFAKTCVNVASDTGVSAHYLLAVAQMRTKIADGDHDGLGFGPFALSADEWATFGASPYFEPPLESDAIKDWTSECAVFGAMIAAMQIKLAGNGAQQPKACELYLAQLIGSAAFKALSAKLGLKVADETKAVAATPDGGDAKAEGVDLSHVMTRFGALLGDTGQKALDAISAAMDPALTATDDLIAQFASPADKIADSTAKVPTTPPASGQINFQASVIPKAHLDMAQLIIKRFGEAGYGVVQQVAALANAIAESGLDPKIKAAGTEDSWGLFQLNHKAGLGVGFDVTTLQDPEQNIKIVIQEIKKFPAFGQATTLADAVQIFVADVEKPANKLAQTVARLKIARQLLTTTAVKFSPDVVFGDSIALGVRQALGTNFPGVTEIGKNPSWVLNAISTFNQSLSGKNVVLSSGLSNGTTMLNVVKQQLEALVQKGAKVDLLGVGPNFDHFNADLSSLATQFGVKFTPLTSSSDGTHPSNYASMLARIESA